MKKSLIALAVAGVVSAPAFAATSNVDVYGIMHFAIEDTSVSGTDMDVVSNSSRIGFKGSEDLGGGLKAVWQIEQQLDPTTSVTAANNNTGAFGGSSMRNTFIGLAGGFGTFVMGRHDTPYKITTTKYNVFVDTIADYAAARLGGVALITGHARASDAVAYISPSFSGLTIAAALVPSMDHLDNGDTNDAISLGAMYANGPLTVDLGWEDIKVVDRKAVKLGAGYAFGDTKLGFVYEDVDNGAGVDRDSWYLSAVHSMGPIALKAQYGQADVGPADQDAWAIGADYNLSKRTAAFVVYGSGDDDLGGDFKGWNIGMRHSF
jgi:predicted porin